MPSLSVRAFAEMLNLPIYEQQRILLEQKYPRQQPQTFRIPYYQTALRGIRLYYQAGNDNSILTDARNRARVLEPDSKAANNLRVIRSFGRSRQTTRNLTVQAQPNVSIVLANDVEIRLRFDICATERDNEKRIFYNCRNAPITGQIARLTLQLAHWVLEQNGTPVPYSALEYIDFRSRQTTRISRIPARTIQLATANARIISTLWPTL